MSLVLVADDHAGIRQLIRSLLIPQYEVVEAQNGTEALALLAARTIDVLVVDLDMPGPSGHDVCNWVRADERFLGIGIIMLTGSHLKLALTDFQVDVLLQKPSGIRSVRTAVESLLARPGRRST